MRKEKKRTEDRGQMKEGERLGRWEGEIKPGQITEDRRQRTEDRGLRTEDRGRRSEVRGQRQDNSYKQ